VSKLRIIRSGWWVAVAAVIVSLAIILLAVRNAPRGGRSALGDGRNAVSYGFELSGGLVPVDHIVASGMPRDGMEAMLDPGVLSISEVNARNQEGRGKFLLDGDRVVGVAVNGQARAYPLRTMRWHEVVNDTLGGVPLVISYNGLCDAVMAAERTVAGEELVFGVSGLLYNSNLLMYDRRGDPAASSLWSQLRARAIAGPSAGRSLALVPAALTTWGDWRNRHPGTDVLAPLEHLKRAYKRDPYHSYFGSDLLRFPVDPLPPDSDLALKERVVVVSVGEADSVFALSRIAGAASADYGAWETAVDGVQIRFLYDLKRGTALVEALDPGRPLTVTRQSFWFAWYATHPGTPPPLPGPR
jgi:hypothetical protein